MLHRNFSTGELLQSDTSVPVPPQFLRAEPGTVLLQLGQGANFPGVGSEGEGEAPASEDG